MEKKYRPWTWADRTLFPQWFDKKGDPEKRFQSVSHITREGFWLSGGIRISFSEVLEHYVQPDGSPCGVEITNENQSA